MLTALSRSRNSPPVLWNFEVHYREEGFSSMSEFPYHLGIYGLI
jgi:hypothetical protein